MFYSKVKINKNMITCENTRTVWTWRASSHANKYTPRTNLVVLLVYIISIFISILFLVVQYLIVLYQYIFILFY